MRITASEMRHLTDIAQSQDCKKLIDLIQDKIRDHAHAGEFKINTTGYSDRGIKEAIKELESAEFKAIEQTLPIPNGKWLVIKW